MEEEEDDDEWEVVGEKSAPDVVHAWQRATRSLKRKRYPTPQPGTVVEKREETGKGAEKATTKRAKVKVKVEAGEAAGTTETPEGGWIGGETQIARPLL